MAHSWTWFQSHSMWPSSKEFVHYNYRRLCIRLWRLIVQHYFASLMTIKQVIFPIVDMCPMYFSQLCIPHNPNRNIQLAQTLLLWDTTNQHFIYAFKYLNILFEAFKWLSLGEAWNLAHMHTLNMTSGLDAVTQSRLLIIDRYNF
jgi:hypothetical protein